MTDLDRLREALHYHDECKTYEAYREHVTDLELQTVLAAARRFLALTETGQRIRWCETHKQSAMASAPWKCHLGRWISLCEVVPLFVIPADYLTEEETDGP